MKFKLDERGFVLVEFAIALPLLILLLFALGVVTLNCLKIAREQAANYALETEAQYVIDRITSDARAAQYVRIKEVNGFDAIIFYCNTISGLEGDDFRLEKVDDNSKYYDYREIDEENGVPLNNKQYYKNILDPRIYAVHAAQGKFFHVYFKRNDDGNFNNPITGDNTYGDHYITKFEVDRNKLEQKILHLTLEMKSHVTKQKVKFATSVFMPACESFKVPSE